MPVSAVSAPDAAVAAFYARVVRHDVGGATALWTARMQANYPPAENIGQRFADTTAIQLLRNETTSEDSATGRATVAVDLLETTSLGTRRYAGTWQLVRGSDGWLLDRPALVVR